jgi:hypothetical protein
MKKLKIPDMVILFIPHNQHRYDTVGDYCYFKSEDGSKSLLVAITRLSDWRYSALVLVHELVELFIVLKQGIKIETIDEFDMDFENRRKPGNTDEPGDSPKAPYRFAHCVATGVERIVAAVLGVCWSTYEKEINSL